MQTASDRYAAIRAALSKGDWELAQAIEADKQCPDCGGYVSNDGYTVDPDKCCSRCEP